MQIGSISWLVAILLAVAADRAPDSPRRPNPFAPSLAQLTDEEEAKVDHVIDRFILADTGKLRGDEARIAVRDFGTLGPDTIPALIRGLNRAARIEHSCPAVVIAKKLHRMLLGSQDSALLEFARDEIGSGVGRTRHKAVLDDLRVACMLRKNALVRAGIVPPRPLQSLTASELAATLSKERGARVKEVLTLLEQRHGPEVLPALARAAASSDKEIQQLGRELLERHLYRQPVPIVKKALKDDHAEVRLVAIRLVAARMPALIGDVVDLLADPRAEVRQAAHEALVSLNKGEDLGPVAQADAAARDLAIEKWRAWSQKKDR